MFFLIKVYLLVSELFYIAGVVLRDTIRRLKQGVLCLRNAMWLSGCTSKFNFIWAHKKIRPSLRRFTRNLLLDNCVNCATPVWSFPNRTVNLESTSKKSYTPQQ